MSKGRVSNWFSKAADAVSLWSIVPAGLFAAIGAYLSTGVAWMAQFGSWGWFMSGLFTFVTFSAGMALVARTRLWRIEASRQERLTGESSPFDPMAVTFERKRLYLRDLAPAGRRFVAGRTFIDCEIIGPGTIMVATRSHESKPWPGITENVMIESDIVQLAPGADSKLAVGFPDCNFHRCKFFNLTLLFLERLEGTDWNWITPDFRQSSFVEAPPPKQIG